MISPLFTGLEVKRLQFTALSEDYKRERKAQLLGVRWKAYGVLISLWVLVSWPANQASGL